MRTVTVRKNLWLFGSRPQKERARKRSSMTIPEAMRRAYAAGQKTFDTGSFRTWIEKEGLGDRSDTLIGRLQREYDKGFEDRIEREQAPPAETATSYKGHKILPTDGGYKLTGRFNDGTVFDSLADAKAFIDSWNRNNPKRGKR